MKDPPCFDGISLDPTIYLRWVQTLKDYFEVEGCSGEESSIPAAKKLQGVSLYWFRCHRRGRAL